MNTNSHYRKEILNNLLNKKNRIASKSKKMSITIEEKQEKKKKLPMHISLKTPRKTRKKEKITNAYFIKNACSKSYK
jgi:hypothetical protein